MSAEILPPEQQRSPTPFGRPTLYTPELASEICARIACNAKISEICQLDHMPCASTVYLWLTRHPDFSDQYAQAQADRTHAMAEEILDISDDGRNDWMERNAGEDVAWVTNGEALQRSRLRVDTRKWLMSKMLPKKYGDRTLNENLNVNVAVTQSLDPRELSPEAREALRLTFQRMVEDAKVIEGEAEES